MPPAEVLAQKDKNPIAPPIAHNMAAEEHFGEGIRESLIDRWDKAVNHFERAAFLEPKNAAIFFKLAEAKMKTGKTQDAVADAQKSVQLDPNNPYYYLLLAQLQEMTGQMKDAAETYRQLHKVFPDNSDFEISVVRSNLAIGEPKKALDMLKTMEKRSGIREEITRFRQQILLKMDKLPEAITEGDRLIDAYPYETAFLIAQAELLIANNKQTEALPYLYQAKVLDPDAGYANLILANLYQVLAQQYSKPFVIKDRFTKQNRTIDPAQLQQSGLQELSIAFANPEVNIDDKVNAMRPYLRQLEGNEQTRALEYAALIAAAHPREAKAFSLYGDILSLAGKNREARDAYVKCVSLPNATMAVWQEVIRLDADLNEVDSLAKHAAAAVERFPNNSLFWLYKARANYFLREYKEVVEAAGQAKRLSNNNIGINAEALSMMGDAYYFLKDFKKSDESFDAALKIEANNEHVLNNYAYFLSVRKEKLPQALKMSTQLVEKAPDNATYLDTHGWVLYQMKRYQEALEFLLKAEKEGSATILEHIGDAYHKLGKRNEAKTYWQKALQKGNAENPDKLNKKIATGEWNE